MIVLQLHRILKFRYRHTGLFQNTSEGAGLEVVMKPEEPRRLIT
jgi:hypothetical protein